MQKAGGIMKIAGIDLKAVDLYFLSWKNCVAIQQAYSKNYIKSHGTIDLEPVKEISFLLKRYIKLQFVDLRLISGADDESLSASDARMAMSIYVLPPDSKHPLLMQIKAILEQLPVKKEIDAIKAQPFSIDNISLVWELISPYKDKLNLTGLWDISAVKVYDVVGDEIMKNAYAKLDKLISKKSRSADEMALLYLRLFDLYQYIKQREQGYDFRFGLNTFETKRELDDFAKRVINEARDCLYKIRDLPEHTGESRFGLMLHRFNGLIAQHTQDEEKTAQRSKQVSPD